MSIALDKFKKYTESKFSELKAQYKELEDGQEPKVFFITCADSRVMPTEMTESGPGELFVLRNAGNLIPSYSSSGSSSEALTLEYAVEVLKIREIVVCGHEKCGAMAGILDLDQLTGLKEVHKHLESCSHQFDASALEELRKSSNKEDSLMKLIELNVEQQIKNLLTYDFVAKRVDAGELTIYGWVYDFVNGKVKVHYDKK